jgi:imidazole glycerol phosphate synthase glutamine amidotransferase subunit
MIGIVDYGAGNLHSVQKAFSHLGKASFILRNPSELSGVSKVVLPGVGSFGHAMREIRNRNWHGPLLDWLTADRPFLGICLGMQLLFEGSHESPDVRGFSIMKGICRRFTENKVPQIGWNHIDIKRKSPLFSGVESGDYFYFVHSYFVVPVKKEVILADTTYGSSYASIVGKGHVFGIQFHPEKSGDMGLRLLKNWEERC